MQCAGAPLPRNDRSKKKIAMHRINCVFSLYSYTNGRKIIETITKKGFLVIILLVEIKSDVIVAF